MGELLRESMPYIVPALAPIVALMLAPLLRPRGRLWLAALMALLAAGLLVDVLVFDHSAPNRLEVPTVFGRGENGEMQLHVWVTEVVEAPARRWRLVGVLYFGLVALWCFFGRARAPKVPAPVPAALLAFVVTLVFRLWMEKAAAPVGLVWALGTSGAGAVISVFLGYYAGRLRMTLASFAGALLLANVLHRLLIVAFGYLATTMRLGTHLDVRAVSDIAPPGIGSIWVQSPTHAWMVCLAVPQMTFALVMASVVGVALGAAPFWLGRRHAARLEASASALSSPRPLP